MVEVNDQRGRYKIEECINLSLDIVVWIPGCRRSTRKQRACVGVDGQREELVSLLTYSLKKLKVVSIMRFGGLGKATLAKQV